MRFFSLDVETANYDSSSICQIGIGMFENGALVDTWESLVDPQSFFHWSNIRVHGITEDMVQGAPAFYEVYPVLESLLSDNIVVHHTPFDHHAFRNAYARFNLEPINIRWLDSARIVRQTWRQFAKGGYNLRNVSNHLGIEFRHHDALEDSVAAGKIVVEACRLTDRRVDEWFELFKTNSK
ncbi:MAG: 3'-5' exonuclease [Bacteroidetes bacterium]|nr:3'-5' exonuclease [Bacteroidota bacterium]